MGTTPAVQRVMVFSGVTPDEVNRANRTMEGAAGKSVNVAKVLQVMGADPVATGFLGGDRGQFIRHVLDQLGVTHEFLDVETGTRECVTIVDEMAGTVTELVEESAALTAADESRLMELVERKLPSMQAMVMSGTIAPGLTVDLYGKCVLKAQQRGVMSVVDAKDLPLLEALNVGPGVVKPNRNELAGTVRRELRNEIDVRKAMEELHERGAQRIVVTAGGEPLIAYDGKRAWRVTIPVIQAINPIGSGDAFTAAMTWRLVEGDDLGEACRWGAAAGTANALSWLPGNVDPLDLERLVREVVVEVV